MSEKDRADCRKILEKAREHIPGRFGQLDELINELNKKSLKEQRSIIWNRIQQKSKGDQFLSPLHEFSKKDFLVSASASSTDFAFGILKLIGFSRNKERYCIDQDIKDHTNWSFQGAYNLTLCSIYLFVELISQTEEIKQAQEEHKLNTPSSSDDTPRHSSRKRREERQQNSAQISPSAPLATPISNTRFCELRMLVESTYITSFESLKDTPDQELTEEQLEALFKRPNIHQLHERKSVMPLGERSFTYENGESLLEHVAQLYLCVNIELFDWTDERYKELLNTKSLAVMKRRLRGAKFTLRELRYEQINDTDRVISGEDL